MSIVPRWFLLRISSHGVQIKWARRKQTYSPGNQAETYVSITDNPSAPALSPGEGASFSPAAAKPVSVDFALLHRVIGLSPTTPLQKQELCKSQRCPAADETLQMRPLLSCWLWSCTAAWFMDKTRGHFHISEPLIAQPRITRRRGKAKAERESLEIISLLGHIYMCVRQPRATG